MFLGVVVEATTWNQEGTAFSLQVGWVIRCLFESISKNKQKQKCVR